MVVITGLLALMPTEMKKSILRESQELPGCSLSSWGPGLQRFPNWRFSDSLHCPFLDKELLATHRGNGGVAGHFGSTPLPALSASMIFMPLLQASGLTNSEFFQPGSFLSECFPFPWTCLLWALLQSQSSQAQSRQNHRGELRLARGQSTSIEPLWATGLVR